MRSQFSVFVSGTIVVYGLDAVSNQLKFGEVVYRNDDKLGLRIWENEGFDPECHSYIIKKTDGNVEVRINQLVCFKPFAVYSINGIYHVRIPYFIYRYVI